MIEMFANVRMVIFIKIKYVKNVQEIAKSVKTLMKIVLNVILIQIKF